jgi:predicted Zn-dependent peptidase
VRERRGLCYYISTSTELYHDCGNFVTQAGVTNNLEKIKEAIKVIREEHDKITKGEVAKDELKRAKELIRGRLLLSLEDSSNVATFFGTKMLLQNKVETPEQAIEKIQSVTVEDISALAKEVFVERNLNFAMIGPYRESDFQKVFRP